MRRERREQAHGPYRRGRKWRVVETSATGARATCSFASEAEALAYLAKFENTTNGRTVSAVVDGYLEHATAQGLRAGSVITLRYRLKGLTKLVERDRLLANVTPAIAAELYARRAGEVKPDTHHAELAAVTSMFDWCIDQGWLRANPFAGVETVGRKSARTDHLRIDETRELLETALADATDAGLAVAMALLMGLRASEVVGRRVRDVDDAACGLWVDGAKTKAGNRHLEIPACLRGRLKKKIAKRDGDELLFGDVDRHWLGYHARRLCELAEVRVTSPHALRRTWAALAAERHTVGDVSEMLGHANVGVTRRHYQPTNAEERQRSAVVLRALAGGKR